MKSTTRPTKQRTARPGRLLPRVAKRLKRKSLQSRQVRNSAHDAAQIFLL